MSFLFSLCPALCGFFLSPMIALFTIASILACKGGTNMYYITLGLPTIIATICWAYEQRTTVHATIIRILLNVMIPIFCMTLFIIHPIGGHAFYYALYWIIPMVLFFIPSKNTMYGLFLTSLRISMVMHAIGSTMWLYAKTTTPLFWMKLIPIVAQERLKLALASWVALIALQKITSWLTKKNSKNLTCNA